MKSRQYDLAKEELERLVFVEPLNDSLKEALMNVYIISGKYDEGKKSFITWYHEYNLAPIGLMELYFKLLLKSHQYTEAKKIMENYSLLSVESKKLYELSLAFHQYNKDYFMNFYTQLDTAHLKTFSPYYPLLNQAAHPHFKNPYLAATLSAIVPGLGKIYTNDYKDGILAFLFVSLSAFQVYRAHPKIDNLKPYAIIYGGLTVAFYTGNVFGAYKSAKRKNALKKEEFLNSFEKISSDRY